MRLKALFLDRDGVLNQVVISKKNNRVRPPYSKSELIICYENIKNINFFKNNYLFFIITNFGVWSLGSPGLDNVPYEKNLQGLIKCYILAIPFIKNTVLSTLTFSYSILLVNTLKNKISI